METGADLTGQQASDSRQKSTSWLGAISRTLARTLSIVLAASMTVVALILTVALVRLTFGWLGR